MSQPTPPLVIDSSRVAADSVRGYRSQIWRSVLAWLDLAEYEHLFLEGAEDFDRVGPTDAEVVQAKDVAGNVTLRSNDVVEAISHAFDHRQRNRGRAVRFRFLSTGGSGVEQGAPFGEHMGGLQLWRDARASADIAFREQAARKIANFLIAEGKLAKPVLDFIQGAGSEALWRELIVPMEWDLQADPTTQVIRDVKDRLILLGAHKGVSAERSERVAELLYAHANETATRQRDRRLGRADLLRLFDDATRQSLPTDLVERLIALVGSHLPTSGSLTTIGAQAPAIGSPPPLPPRYYERVSVLDDVGRRLSHGDAVVLEGSTGAGKSTIVAGLATASGEVWGWVDLRGLEPGALMQALARVEISLSSEPGVQGLVLDDIGVPADPRPLEAPLVRLHTALAARGARLIVTSGAPWPPRLQQALALGAEGRLQVPPFERSEISAYLLERGCPADTAVVWAGFIEIHTLGHAQLVHARIATIEAQGFPEADLADLPTTPPDVVEARDEARRLISTLDPPARALIYRLSLMVGTFTRAQALALAGLPDVIDEPGLVLDTLIGPWLETVVEGLYRVSPLLSSVGREVNGEAWTTSMHRQIGRSLASARVLTPSDASSILLHATLSQDWSTIGQLSFGLMRADTETWVALSQNLSWFTIVATGSNAGFIKAEPFSRFLIRLLQFRLAAALGDSGRAIQIIETFDVELPPTTSEPPLLMARYFFLASVVLRPEAALPIARYLEVGVEYLVLSDRFAPELAGTTSPEFEELIAGPDGAPDKAGAFGLNLSTRIQTRTDLEALLTAAAGQNDAQLRRLLWLFGGSETSAGIVMDRIWLAERASGAPDWATCLALFRRTLDMASKIGLLGLAHAAARQIVRVQAEDLGDADEALRSADAFAAELDWSPSLKNEKASVLLHAGRHDEALTIWRGLLPRWRPRDEFDLQITFACRLAAIAAGKLGAWAEAADWLGRAREATESDQAVYRAALLVDEGFALWMAKDNAGALDRLVDDCVAIDDLPADAVDRKAFTLRKRAGHILMWIAALTSGRAPGDQVEPAPAICSTQDVIEDLDVPSTPSAALWAHLAEFELEANLGVAVFRRCEPALTTTPFALLRLSFGIVRIRQRLITLSVADLVEVAADWAEALELSKIYYRDGGLGAADPLPSDARPIDRSQFSDELVLTALVNAVFVHAARRAINAKDIAAWRLGAARAGVATLIGPWLDFTEQVLVDRTIDGTLVMRSVGVPWAWGTVATLQVATDPAVSPADLMTVHAYWVGLFSKAPGGMFVLGDVETLVARAWLTIAEQPFRLSRPMVTVPPLKAACSGATTAWPKIGTILLAAAQATPAPTPPDMIASFQQLLAL